MATKLYYNVFVKYPDGNIEPHMLGVSQGTYAEAEKHAQAYRDRSADNLVLRHNVYGVHPTTLRVSDWLDAELAEPE